MDALKLFLLMIAIILPVAYLVCFAIDVIMRWVERRFG